jgi:hypothetical protein
MGEPTGDDFSSPTLNEAECMRRRLPPTQFQTWFDLFLPGMYEGLTRKLFVLAHATDLSNQARTFDRAQSMLGLVFWSATRAFRDSDKSPPYRAGGHRTTFDGHSSVCRRRLHGRALAGRLAVLALDA